MRGFFFYLFYPIIYVVALSPFWLLYAISDFFFFIVYYIIGYRKKVVLTNLRNSFPEKSEKEIQTISKKYYGYMCDLFMESIKTLTMSERSVRKRLKMHHVDMLNAFHEKGQSFIIVMGHFGNWELAGPCFSLNCKHQLYVVYKPLADPHFEKMFVQTRTKFSTKIVQMQNTLRAMTSYRREISATAFIADQTPVDVKTAYWMNFLNQDTPVYTGPEKIAKMFNYPVVYMHVDRTKRGYYEVTPTVLFDNPKETEENEITIGFNKKLEKNIREKPEIWLWSHKRWKRKRTV